MNREEMAERAAGFARSIKAGRITLDKVRQAVETGWVCSNALPTFTQADANELIAMVKSSL